MADDIFDLYNFEDQIEPAVKAVLATALTAASISGVTITTTREKTVKTTPRIEVAFALSLAMAQRTAIGQAVPKQVPNAFEGTLSLLLATTRPVSSGNADIHGRVRGLIRFNLSAAARVFTDSNLTKLQILDMLPEAQTSRVFDPKEQDLSLLNYHVWFAIRAGAWPAVPA